MEFRLNHQYDNEGFYSYLDNIGDVGECPSGAPCYTLEQAWTISSRLRDKEEDIEIAKLRSLDE